MHFQIWLISKRGRFRLSSIQWALTVADEKGKKKEDITEVKPKADADYVKRPNQNWKSAWVDENQQVAM